ncbi:MAG: hypothetical protein ACYSVY_16190, partial [Planctomycetota bacterium]
DLDVRPSSCPNPFNRKSLGLLPIALVGTGNLDVAEVDLTSLLLARADGVGGSVAPNEGPPGPHSVFEDVASPFEGELCDCHDYASDGILDLSLKFWTQEVREALELNALPAGATVELVVTGALLDGTAFEASDCIKLVPSSNVTGISTDQPAPLDTAGTGPTPPDSGMIARPPPSPSLE